MRRLRFLVGVCAIAALGTFATTATAEEEPPPPCELPGMTPTPITGIVNGNLTITGDRVVPFGQTLTVNGNLRIAPGACFEAMAGSASIAGNVNVARGGVFAFGYGPGSYSVGGNVVANQPGSLYIGNATIRGNVVSNGGGDPGRNFPIKDSTIGGNVIVQGWHGLWIGLLRNNVGGNVIFSRNLAAADSTSPGSDSSEVVQNDIRGNLICQRNTPDVQIGDSGGLLNTVGGNAIGECASVSN